MRRARSTRERDELAVIPRFGYGSVAEYYREISVSSRIEELDVPSLLVLSDNDPVVPVCCTHDALRRASKDLTTIHVPSGGHIYFPRDLDLGQGGALGLEPQVVRWLSNNC